MDGGKLMTHKPYITTIAWSRMAVYRCNFTTTQDLQDKVSIESAASQPPLWIIVVPDIARSTLWMARG